MSNIHIYIGPNGRGKTFALNAKRDELIKSGIEEGDIFYMPAEIYLEDEIKDTDTTSTRSKTIEFLLTDFFEMSKINKKKEELKNEFKNQISNVESSINNAFDKIASINEIKRSESIITPNDKLTISKYVSINANDFKKSIGTGQKYLFFLELLKESKKKYVFLDEPEQYSHPSLQNEIAGIINYLSKDNKEIYVATHSPKLITMLDASIEDIVLINDSLHTQKKIEYIKIIKEIKNQLNIIGSFIETEKKMYNETDFENIIKTYYYKDFIEALFTSKVIIVEGYADEVFVKKVLKETDHLRDDYVIFMSNGKNKIPLFARIFSDLGIDIRIYFDKDDENKDVHRKINDYIINNFPGKFYMFDAYFEEELGTNTENNKRMSVELINFLETWVFDKKYDIW